MNEDFIFEYPQDKEYFERLFLFSNKFKIENFRTLFDFRPPNTKRREFNLIRNLVLRQLLDIHGMKCMLNMECCNLASGIAIDHLIPLSTNMLNKAIRNIKPEKGKKVKTQSFGSNHIDNLLIACNNCNNHKKHRIIDREKLIEILVEKEKCKTDSK
jgi:5-methylcytosine-specific restriction endonuclease McrA